MKKVCYLFVFDGFADWQVSHATTGIAKSEEYTLKTISIEKKPVLSMSGMTLMPDYDFIPEVDLYDISSDNTAMLILPGGAARRKNVIAAILPLILHCLDNNIPVAASSSSGISLTDQWHDAQTINRIDNFLVVYGTSAVDFAREIFDTLAISDEQTQVFTSGELKTLSLKL